MSVDLRHLRAFVVVVEERSISRAAPRLFITQPALSRQIKQLEDEVGQPLLVRGPHGVEPTEVGRELIEKARAAIEATEAALSVGEAARPHGRLTLGFPFAGGRDRWYGLTKAFLDEFPAVDIEVRESFSGQLQRQVLAGELDAAVSLHPRHLQGLTYTHLLEDQLSVWLNDRHPLAGREQLTPAELSGYEVSLLNETAARDSLFNESVRDLFQGVEPPRFKSNREIYPPRLGAAPDYLGISVRLDYPDEVSRIPLVPERTMPFEGTSAGRDQPLGGARLSRLRSGASPGAGIRGGHGLG
ncbi:MAG: LysR family transcriptional regulator [Solirubrobacterales bacterium]|nr:LysR family transcriptional regulator [Solirubrobacterales bacterium]